MKVEGKAARRAGVAAAVLIAGALILPAPARAQNGKITGKVTLDGTAPAPVKLKMDADPICAQKNPNATSEEVVVGPGGGLQNVFVRVTAGAPAGPFPPPKDPVTIDQDGCHYKPHVVGVQVGQPLKIMNDDGTLHNVHGMPKKNPPFNFAMPKFVKQKETTFTTPEVMVAMKCDVHPWMNGFIGVVDNPFFAVTGPDGTYTIQNLPPGEYTIEAWQEKYGTQTGKVKVDANGTATSDFKFKAS
ncbi:MAG TPA: carboxypeptidase regulatory-like domain-containing protein [Candidatus Binatia bacterium]|nr:carboxypeptidase regulatory-like domain-containing protein [Candidatus Binatia bacterium]